MVATHQDQVEHSKQTEIRKINGFSVQHLVHVEHCEAPSKYTPTDGLYDQRI